jgi:sialic acid synthase SpsE
VKAPADAEQELRAFARRSIFARRDIQAGERFTPENVAVLRCGERSAGLPPADWSRVVGRCAARPVTADSAVEAADLA